MMALFLLMNVFKLNSKRRVRRIRRQSICRDEAEIKGTCDLVREMTTKSNNERKEKRDRFNRQSGPVCSFLLVHRNHYIRKQRHDFHKKAIV